MNKSRFLSSEKIRIKKFRPFWKRKGGPGDSQDQEEQEQIAAGRLTIYLIPMIKNWQKKRILRKVADILLTWSRDFQRILSVDN